MSSITADLKRTFDLASLRHRAKSLTRPADWEKANEITKRYARETSKQEKLYKRDYISALPVTHIFTLICVMRFASVVR